ncbi:SMP-30/gluconolactonase/LRE family protein [Lacihabitans sp. CCS-44]|uniref:SMP-30/gluconolactonase/LRE family protein n=1 Tax=Lacihabitans sp. CCS-44 TaxID=2487331 RepID=UPI0020CCFB76|nr:SMP-30/gluconolactonase/LRE family protein [Lacihabitans sp. CCS-44]MCP9755339.1 SMP-30/gluconolactonase/LRE family protein [Lacihabitans sp. CCS-44]
MKKIKFKFLILFSLISLGGFAQDFDTLSFVKKGAKLVKISSQFKFTEGPAADKKGNVFFTDQPNNKIWKYDTKGQLSVFLENAGRSNGLYFDKKGNILSCADEKNQLWSIDKKGNHTVLLDNYEGKLLNGPNDLWQDNKDGIYFTDPFYPRDYWTRKTQEIDKKRVYYLPKGAKVPLIMDEDFKQPNGIVGTADGKNLFVADIGASKTYKYDIDENGKLTNRQLFAKMGSDGMTLDNEGNLYLTGRGVTVFDKNGKQIAKIPVPSGWTANICFGGKNRKLLFITASESVYTLDMNVKGVN